MERPYYQTDHYHCWQENNPPCGLKGKHRCCLCGLSVPDVTSEDIDSDGADAFERQGFVPPDVTNTEVSE